MLGFIIKWDRYYYKVGLFLCYKSRQMLLQKRQLLLQRSEAQMISDIWHSVF